MARISEGTKTSTTTIKTLCDQAFDHLWLPLRPHAPRQARLLIQALSTFPSNLPTANQSAGAAAFSRPRPTPCAGQTGRAWWNIWHSLLPLPGSSSVPSRANLTSRLESYALRSPRVRCNGSRFVDIHCISKLQACPLPCECSSGSRLGAVLEPILAYPKYSPASLSEMTR